MAGQVMAVSFTANDLRSAYAPNVTLNGSGQRVGIFSLANFDQNDITAYEDQNTISHVTVTPILLDGYDGGTTYDIWQQEITGDIQFAIAMAPGLTEVVVFEGNPHNAIPNNVLNAMATHLPRINQFTSSWSWNGGPSDTTDNIFKLMQAQGQTFFEASGDSDANWQGSYFNPNHYSVDDPRNTTTPQDNPYITIVGGTVLTTTGTSYGSEKVWNECSGGVGSSGGVSAFYPIPTWQQPVSMSRNGGSTTYRNAPDVSLVAWNVSFYYHGNLYAFGGTSASAPLWAGFCALANQQAASGALPPIGFLNPALYKANLGYPYSQMFHDIVSGNNEVNVSYCVAGGPDPYTAVAGYDLFTGWGSPVGQMTIDALAPVPLVPPLGLIGWWKGEGNANNSASPDNGIPEGNLTYAQAEVGQGFLFSGADSDVRIPNVSGQFNVGGGAGFTVEGWIKLADVSMRPIVEWDSPSTFGVHLWSSVDTQGSLYANIVDTLGVSHGFSTPVNSLAVGLLQHIALTYDKSSGRATMYIGGIGKLRKSRWEC